MTSIQIIALRGRPGAIAVNDTAIIGPDVAAADLAHVQAKALYALEIEAGTCPYTDAAAELFARRVLAARRSGFRAPNAHRRCAAARP